MAELVYVDEDGEEIRRETKQRGRPPKGSVKQENGDFIVRPVAEAAIVEYILLDEDGKVVGKEVKGRGRNKAGYVLQDQGKFAGHWVKVGESPVAVE